MNHEASDEAVFNYYSKVKLLKVTDVKELNLLIDQINTLNISDTNDLDEAYENLLCCIAERIPSENDHMLSKFCSLIYFYIYKQGKVLSSKCMEELAKFLISAINRCGEWVLNDVLMALSVLLQGDFSTTLMFLDVLLRSDGILIKLLVPCEHDDSIQYNAFECLLSVLSNKTGENLIEKDLLEISSKNCIAVLKVKIESSKSDVLSLKILITSLKCLQHIYSSKNVPKENFGELLGTLKCVLFYGLPGTSLTDVVLHPTLPAPDVINLEESQGESDSTTYPKLRNKKRTRRTCFKKTPQKKESQASVSEEESDCKYSNKEECASDKSLLSPSSHKSFRNSRSKSSSSDSEFSDAESHASKVKSLLASIRQNAYQALLAVVKTTDKKIMFSYWSSFLPDLPAMPGIAPSQNICTTILKDPAPQVRLCALSLLAEMLKGSKQFLSYADGSSSRHLSFTSLSSILASIISELHRCLLLALLSENSSILLTQLLKCYAVLCENVPYSKINNDILLKLLKHLKGFLHHKDTQVRVACLTAFGSIVNSDQVPPEIGQLILSPDFDTSINSLQQPSVANFPETNFMNKELPWIVNICKKNIFSGETLPVQLESLQLLSIFVGKHFFKILSVLSILEELILFCLNEPDAVIQLHGAKLLDVFGRCTNNSTYVESTPDLYVSVKNLWHSVLKEPLIRSLTNENQKTLQSVCCDCLSSLPQKCFEELAHKQQIMYITILLGLASDGNPNVRGAAIRCLGVYTLFPCLTEDLSFLSDVSENLIKSVNDPNVNVRFKASWSLGNLSDALFINRSNDFIINEISPHFFHTTGMACVQFSKDCDRVKANAVRALGNFLHYIPEHFLGIPMMQDFIQNAVTALKTSLCANMMKVCWNACYALGNMLKNTNLIKFIGNDLEEVLVSLLNTLKCPNFKVRISASQALTVIASRDLYGNLFCSVWIHLISALFAVSVDVNFKEIKHQENLHDQLCYSLCQLASLITLNDLSLVTEQTAEASEILLTSMWNFGSRTTKEKAEDVCAAIEHVTLFKGQIDAGNISQTVIILEDVLNQAILAFYGQDNEC